MTFSHKATPDARLKAMARLVADLSADDHPILVGPWRSEVGFEALYWMPFLRKLASRVPHFDKRAAVVTRGGFAPLYKSVASQGMDLYALRSLTEIRRENIYDHGQNRDSQGHKTLKQLALTPWDEAVIQDAADALSISLPYHILHPGWMYWACAPWWQETAGMSYLLNLCDFRPLEKHTIPGSTLPDRYVAVKFYARATFPYPHPEVAEFVQQTVAMIAAQAPVVILTAGSEFDDHLDIPITGPNIQVLPAVPPEQNLAAQAAVIAGAKCFVGTYGGVAQLALRMGVPSASFYTEFGGTSYAHLALSGWLSARTRVPFLAGSLADSQFWKQITSVPKKAEIAPQMVSA